MRLPTIHNRELYREVVQALSDLEHGRVQSFSVEVAQRRVFVKRHATVDVTGAPLVRLAEPNTKP